LSTAPHDPFGNLTMWACLAAVATVSADTGRRLLAVRLAGAASRLAGEIGMVSLPAHAALLEHVREICQQAMTEDAYTRATADGARAGLAEALAYASRGRGSRRRPASGWNSLTPTELRIAAAVTDGLSNPQIADRMLISRRTVTTHLTSIFRKLGISSRAELAAIQARNQRDDGGQARSNPESAQLERTNPKKPD
jgi:DNA-binding CsgD family transcriptional regulator